MPITRRIVGLCFLALVSTGCSGLGSPEADSAEAAALRFSGLVKADPAAACDLLARGTLRELESSFGPCESSLPEQDLPSADASREVQVFGKQAMVALAGDTIFLARFPDGWRVTAAGCVPRDDRPYDCSVKGP